MKSTDEQILNRLKEVEARDFFAFESSDLMSCLSYEAALKADLLVEGATAEEWAEVQITDPRKEILDYKEFAYEKAHNKRGLSASRTLSHLSAWIFVDDPDFHKEILPLIENYTDYGIPALDKIYAHYTK